MEKETEEIKLFDAPDLVIYRTNLEGWTGSDNLYYGKGKEGEERARMANCTHLKCKCGNIYKKKSYCQPCSDKRSKENFIKLEAVHWDGESPICIRCDDKFFYDMEDVLEYCENEEIEISELELMACEKQLNISEINIDELNEEYSNGDFGVTHYHPEIAKKVEELNELIRNTEPVIWFQTNKRILI